MCIWLVFLYYNAEIVCDVPRNNFFYISRRVTKFVIYSVNNLIFKHDLIS